MREKKFDKNKSAGITLIALVVTIIVLLILAGISIQMLTGENGILQRAVEAKENTEDVQLKEQAELIKNAMIKEKKSKNEELSKEELILAISKNDVFSGSIVEETGVITTKEGKQIIVTDDINIRTGEKKSTESLRDGEHILLNLNGIDTAIECIVIYDSLSEVGANGVQVITADVIEENVVIGAGHPNSEQDDMIPEDLLQKSDAEKAQWSYNNAITNLNLRAEKYINSDYILDARCVGSDPINKDKEGEMFTNNDYEYLSQHNEKYKGLDENYKSDYNKMTSLNIIQQNTDKKIKDFWLASRKRIFVEWTFTTFEIGYVNNDGVTSSSQSVIIPEYSGKPLAYGYKHGFRPVFKLKNNIDFTKVNTNEK